MRDQNMSDQTTLSDDELARDDPDLCEHGWSRLHPQSCPECEDESSSAQRTLPWRSSALEDWSIGGMNHYHVDGIRRLFVAMVRGGSCIKAEGADTPMLWEELEHKARSTPERPFREVYSALMEAK
jgi:hypothetical protein